MGFLSGGGQKTQITKYSGLQVQTTSSCVPVPIIYGQNISSPNVVWYNGFVAVAQNSTKGKTKTTSWDYHCDIIMGICEGPINAIGLCWTTSTTPVELITLGLALVPGATPGENVPYFSGKYPTQYLTYPGVAYVFGTYYDLGTSATVGSNNLEIFGILSGSGANHADADPAQVIYDFLTNVRYGVGFPAASIDTNSLFENSGDSSYQTYCWANYLAISPVLNQQESASSILDRWLKLTNSTAVWSGGKLKFLPFGDASVTGGWATAQKTWTPNVTPLYDLTDEDFLYVDGEDPIKITRSDPYAAANQQSLEIQARADSYNTGPIVAFDQSAIDRFGLRVGSAITAHEICDLLVAQASLQLILQRGLYIRLTYTFKASWEFCLLDPMDLVTLTDARLGLNKTVVRIIDVEEDDSGYLTVTAEEFPQGVATGVVYPTQSRSNGVPNSAVTANPVNTPIIIEPTSSLSGGAIELWIGASGASADPNWGGCIVWASLDGTSYAQVATISGAAAQGVTTSALSAFTGSNPDTAETLGVDLTESGGTLSSTTSAGAAAGVTLCYVGGEYLAFTTATLTAANRYNLTGLYRGMAGIASMAVPSGSPVLLLSQNVLKYGLPTGDIGDTIHLKFQSVNIFGGGIEDISTCTAYPYTITAAGLDPATQPYLGTMTVAALHALTGMVTGSLAIVTDASSPSYLAALTGGGSTRCSALYNGMIWVAD